MKRLLVIPVLALFLVSCDKKAEPPAPYGAIPTEGQMNWHKMEFYAFIHFTLNTWTDREWGYGDESPGLFDPSELDCRQWAAAAKEAGMKGIILTAKHHDGFCLWPSEYTEHSVKNSPWKDGKGDVLRELADACEEYGLKLGLYLSPWDRNSAVYGTEEYITYYRNQLRELLTDYGDVFEVWFDGANGGDGYYGGANEIRKIDRKTYYDWPNTRAIVRELQPEALMFSDAGPDVRWVGNEHGFAGESNWSTLNRDEFYPGTSNSKPLPSGQEGGTHWVPAECDVSIRPGWFYHESQDSLVKTVEQLMDIYYKSVGRNASFLLNLPPDRRGLIHENDVKRLKEFRQALDREFEFDLAAGKNAVADSHRGSNFKASNVTDGDYNTYWCTSDSVRTGSITIDIGRKTEINRILVQEYIPLGQRVRRFSVEAFIDGKWTELVEATTIGYKRILKLPLVNTKMLRLNIEDSRACPLINNVELYRSPG